MVKKYRNDVPVQIGRLQKLYRISNLLDERDDHYYKRSTSKIVSVNLRRLEKRCYKLIKGARRKYLGLPSK